MINFNQHIKNSKKFSPAAEFFKEHKCYTLAPRGTTDYVKYWEQETDRCIYGYTAPDGDSITGYHYFYLNYSPIMRLKEIEYKDRFGNIRKRRERVFDFPSFWDYDYYYFNAIEEAENVGKHLAVLKCRQRGYEQPYSELIGTSNGFVEMGSLQVGDQILNPDGTETKVIEIFEQGYKDVYELTLADGRTVKCGADHLWEVVCANNNTKHKVMKTHDMLCNGLYNMCMVNGKKYNAYKYYLPAISPIRYSEKDLNIPPYVLGALLGDGAITAKTPRFSSIDQPIIDRIKELLGGGFEFKYDPSTSCEYRIVDKERFLHKSEFKNGQYGVNRLHRWIEQLGLKVSCEYKFIPDEYKFSSVEQRMELIRGLMDTDGYISASGSMCFTNTSKQLIDDVVEVLRSLGILCSVSKVNPANGGICNERTILGRRFSYRIYIKGNPNIFYLPRKKNRIKKSRKFSNKVAIVDIKYLGYQEQQRCIMVDNPNHLYITRDYIPTHNSFKGASMLVRNYELIPGSKNFAVASEQKFLVGDGLLTKAWQIMDFIDKNTAWAKQRLTSTRMERVSGYKVTDEFGKQTEQGYLSSITGITLKNDPERLRGTRGKLVLFEEGGKFPGLLDTWRIEQPAVETDDGVAFGLLLAFGTGGTEGGAFDGLKELFYKPDAYNVLSFPNIWDDNAENSKCGFFVPAWSNLESFDENGNRIYMDEDGNSLREKTIEELIKQRNVIKDGGASQQSIDRFISERPIKPQEAVLELGKNIFPRKLLMDQLTRIRTNKKLQSMKHVVDLSWDGNGGVIATEKQTGDITNYPLRKDAKPAGSVVIWEYPVKDPPFGLYIGGCLTPGEKVCTQRGLVNVEDVTLDDQLISKNGDFVEIKNLQRYNKVNEPIFEIKPYGSFRTTKFTGEHPIWINKNGFIKAKEVSKGSWLEIPNRFMTCKSDYVDDIKLKLYYFYGLWLGDGFCTKNGNSYDIYISIGKDEKELAQFYDKIVYELFGRKCIHIHKQTEQSRRFTNKDLFLKLKSMFGDSAYNKRIPDEIKSLSVDYKRAFLQGYLDSNGSVFNTSRGIRTNFTSVNLQLLEDVQDMLFSMQIANSIVLHQRENVNKQNIHSMQSYRINIAKSDQKELYYNAVFNSRKIQLLKNTIEYVKSKMPIKFVGDKILIQVENVKQSSYTGVVYNFECDTHTFMCRNILTHNCDPLNLAGYNRVKTVKIQNRQHRANLTNCERL